MKTKGRQFAAAYHERAERLIIMANNKKSIHRSIRITDDAARYIDGFDGESFNKKLENMIIGFQTNFKKERNNLDKIKRERQAAEERLITLNEKIRNRKRLLDNLNTIERYVSYCINYVDADADERNE